jgi:hypothetical protein
MKEKMDSDCNCKLTYWELEVEIESHMMMQTMRRMMLMMLLLLMMMMKE